MKLLLKVTLCSLVLLLGCNKEAQAFGSKEGDIVINKNYDSTMETITGTEFEFDLSQSMEDFGNNINEPTCGVGIYYPESFLTFAQEKLIGVMPIPGLGVAISYCDIDMEALMSGAFFNPSEDDFYDIYRMSREQKGKNLTYDKNFYEKELLYSDKDFEYYFYSIKNIEKLDASDTAKSEIAQLLEMKDEIKNNCFIFPAQSLAGGGVSQQSYEATNSFGTFNAKTITGKDISDNIFADYDVTMVSIWATWCKPCVNEMAELEELYKSLPENVNLITICSDADTQNDLAKKILETKGATFDTIVADDTIRNDIVYNYNAFPTTVFVDKEGNIIGDLMLGAPPSNVVETYMAQIMNRLNSIQQ